MKTSEHPAVAIVMGSSSDWETMRHAATMLDTLKVPHENRIVSAHRTPDLLFEYAKTARERGLEVLIAGAGGAAHLPGMLASMTTLPVLGVPVESSVLRGVDSLLSIVQMPAGVPVGTLAIGRAGAVNAALLAAQFLAARDEDLRSRIEEWRRARTDAVLAEILPEAQP
ncbi:MAG: 5-(carboxyamino)imidazole ribonucleotide mutase [Candidatus Binatia bacterium]